MNDVLILGWARSAVTPVGGALSQLQAHEIGAPVLQGLLQRFAIPAHAIDTVIAGNALGAGGNPARMVALAAGLPERVAALSIDSQCCAGLDAVTLAAGMLAAGNAELVIAGGVEAWSRAPIRQHRPLLKDEAAMAYERPAFAPDPARDPDLLLAAARHAWQAGISRTQQDAWALASHARALAARERMRDEIVAIGDAHHDSYPRHLDAAKLARMPLAAMTDDTGITQEDRLKHAVSRIAVSPRADGAAFVVMATRAAAERLQLQAQFIWRGGLSLGAAPEMPMLAAAEAAQALLARVALQAKDMWGFELHDAFAAQAIAFCQTLTASPAHINRGGGGLGRGHPIGASGAIALVRLLADMHAQAAHGTSGLAAIAGAGGIGAAAIVQRL